MATVCAHCGSADTLHLFSTVECLSCNGHTDHRGRKVLPDSLQYPPNSEHNLRQFQATNPPRSLIDAPAVWAAADANVALYGDPFGGQS